METHGDHMGTTWRVFGMVCGPNCWRAYYVVHTMESTMESHDGVQGRPSTMSKVETFTEVNFSMLENLQICVANLGLFWTVSRATAPERTEMRKAGLARGTMHMRDDARGAAAREAGLKARLPR